MQLTENELEIALSFLLTFGLDGCTTEDRSYGDWWADYGDWWADSGLRFMDGITSHLLRSTRCSSGNHIQLKSEVLEALKEYANS